MSDRTINYELGRQPINEACLIGFDALTVQQAFERPGCVKLGSIFELRDPAGDFGCKTMPAQTNHLGGAFQPKPHRADLRTVHYEMSKLFCKPSDAA